jgi:PAS domain S-box-containing protein
MARGVLVVEDSPTQAEQLKRLLEEAGHPVTVARGGQQALAAARRDPPALVISDIMMPEMDGYALCAQFKSDPALRDIPVVLVTVLTAPHDIIKALECGADAFVRKPYDEHELLSRVSYVQANQALRKSGRMELGVEIELGGRRHFIGAERRQILDLLISTYEQAVDLNEELAARQKELQRASEFLQGLYRIAKALNQATTQQEVLETALEQAMRLPDVQAGWVSLLENTGFRLVAARGLPPALAAPGAMEGDCLCRRKLRAGELGHGIHVDACERLQRAEGDTRGLRHHAAIPLWIDDRTLGVMNLAGHGPDTFRDQDLTILNGVGNQVAIALERARLLEQLEGDVRRRTAALTAEIAERERTEARLRANEQRLSVVYDSVLDPLILLSVEPEDCYRFLSINRAFLTTTGLSLEQVIGRRIEEVLPESSQHLVIGRYREAIRENRTVTWEETAVFPAGTRVGEVSVTPLVDETGSVTQLVGAIHDLTERKRVEEARRQTEKLVAMGELLAGVAHELNNPLSAVLGQAFLLRQAAGEGPLATRADRITQAAERCARIVKNFLALAREYPPERQEVRLDQVVREAVELLAYPLRMDNVEVRLDLAGDLPVLWADTHQLHQVVVNLVTNAHHALRQTERPRRLTIATGAGPAPSRVWLEVSDTGPGISPEIQARIFEPFFTTKPPGQGTGLGLSLCRGIVEAHGGSVQVESLPGRGATLRVELPVHAPPVAARLLQPEAPSSSIRGRAILVVDDETEVAGVLAEMLAADGHQVETAPDGAVALEKLGQRTYDLILSDLRMPRHDGPGLYRELERRHPQLLPRLVFLTGDTLGVEIRSFLEETGAPSLTKPFALEEIRRIVERVLRAG